MKKIFLFLFLTFSLYSDSNLTTPSEDLYTLSFSPDSNCSLLKNGKKIPTFDLRFKRKEPKSAYTCSALQKEQYRECSVLKKDNISAFFFGYGSYDFTNLIIAFKNPHKSTKSSVTVTCSKRHPSKKN